MSRTETNGSNVDRERIKGEKNSENSRRKKRKRKAGAVRGLLILCRSLVFMAKPRRFDFRIMRTAANLPADSIQCSAASPSINPDDARRKFDCGSVCLSRITTVQLCCPPQHPQPVCSVSNIRSASVMSAGFVKSSAQPDGKQVTMQRLHASQFHELPRPQLGHHSELAPLLNSSCALSWTDSLVNESSFLVVPMVIVQPRAR